MDEGGMSNRQMTCEKCLNEPCPVVKGAKSVLGAWARERRRQLGAEAHNIDRGVKNQAEMDKAMDTPLEKALKAVCDCPCHAKSQR